MKTDTTPDAELAGLLAGVRFGLEVIRDFTPEEVAKPIANHLLDKVNKFTQKRKIIT